MYVTIKYNLCVAIARSTFNSFQVRNGCICVLPLLVQHNYILLSIILLIKMNNLLIYGYIKSLKFHQLTIPDVVFQIVILYSQLEEYINGKKKINIASKFIGKIIISPWKILQYDHYQIQWKLKINKVKNASISIGYKPTDNILQMDSIEMMREMKKVGVGRIARRMRGDKIKTGDNLDILIKYSKGKDYDMLYQYVIATIMLNGTILRRQEKWNHFWSTEENYNLKYAIYGKIEGELCEIELIDCFEIYA